MLYASAVKTGVSRQVRNQAQNSFKKPRIDFKLWWDDVWVLRNTPINFFFEKKFSKIFEKILQKSVKKNAKKMWKKWLVWYDIFLFSRLTFRIHLSQSHSRSYRQHRLHKNYFCKHSCHSLCKFWLSKCVKFCNTP